MNDHTIAAMTASAIGTKRNRATPLRKNIGTKTMQMQSSDTNAGVTICRAPSMIEVSTSLPCSRCQLMFSIVTVASSTRIPTASASPPQRHDVERLAERREHRDRSQDRKRDRGRDDDGGPPAPEEQEDHEARQRRGHHSLEGDAADGAPHEHRLVADERHVHAVRKDG